MATKPPHSKRLLDRLKQNRISLLGLLAVIVAVGSFYQIRQNYRQRKITLFRNEKFTETELGQMQIAFGKASLNQYEIKAQQVLVPHDCRTDYLTALSNHGALPKYLLEDAAPDNSIFISPSQRKQNYLENKRIRLRQILSKLRFVAEVWVDFDESRTTGFRKKTQRSILVAIRPNDSQYLSPLQVTTIVDLVKGAFVDISLDNVAITDLNAGLSFSGADLKHHSSRQLVQSQATANRLLSILRDEFAEWPELRIRISPSFPGNGQSEAPK